MAKTSTLLACAALAIALAAPLSADAGPKQEAKAHIDRASKAHKAGDLDKALIELKAAYGLDPQPQLLYAMGQIYTKLGRCSEASEAYLRFLSSGADTRTAQVVKQAIDSCKPQGAGEPAGAGKEPAGAGKEPASAGKEPAGAGKEPAPPPKGPATPSSDEEDPLGKGKATPAATEPPPPKKRISTMTPEPGPSEPPRSETDRPFYTDVFGDVLVIGGVAAFVLGGVAYNAARTDISNAEKVNTIEKYEDLVDKAHTKRLAAVALAGGGAVLVTAGVLRFMMRDKHTEVRRVGMAPAHGGGLLTWTRSF